MVNNLLTVTDGIGTLKAVLFDLDYTLYDQRQYVEGAFADVAKAISQDCGQEGNSLRESLWRTWTRLGTDYAFLFNEWLEEAGILTPEHITLCVRVFHAHCPEGLVLYEGADEVLGALKQKYTLGLITDGDPGMQRNKLRALNLKTRFDFILYPQERSWRKPDDRIFHWALETANLKAGEAVYVGDHPVKDIAGARRAGLKTVRLLRGEFRYMPDDPVFPPHRRIHDLPDLSGLLKTSVAE